jgi:hypothetical protein
MRASVIPTDRPSSPAVGSVDRRSTSPTGRPDRNVESRTGSPALDPSGSAATTRATGTTPASRESASRASMHGWRLLEMLEAVSAEKKHACYGECFV